MIVVIGAGVVGLAAGLSLAKRGHAVTVIERHARAGLETSTHNSGVIHAGLYHPPDSLKAALAVEGRERLYAFCAETGVRHARCGKLIVAGTGDLAALARVELTARANGVPIQEVDRAFVREREPHVAADAALWSPESGWVDADDLVQTLVGALGSQDANLLVGTPVVGIEPAAGGGLVVVTPSERIDAAVVVNAAGLYADDVSRLAGGEAFTIYPCRGEYAELAPSARRFIRGLVYPVPHASGHGLGVHMTRTLSGAVWVGPTIRFQDDKRDYERHRLPVEAFLEPARRLVPELDLRDLKLSGSGIRAKLHPPSESFADFMIRRDALVPALVHAAGIDSPGLTSCLAIGERLATIVDA